MSPIFEEGRRIRAHEILNLKLGIDALSEEPDVAEDPEEDVKDGVSRCCDNGMFEQSDNK